MTPSESEVDARLSLVVDGVVAPAEQARATWQRFSEYMEAHRGDLAGFARTEGFLSAHPRSDGGKAVLVLSHTEPQEPYGKPASGAGSGGSSVRQSEHTGASGRAAEAPKELGNR